MKEPLEDLLGCDFTTEPENPEITLGQQLR